MEYFKNKTILVTGAAGFVGSHLTETLLSMGAVVIGVDNFITGSFNNLASIKDNENFSFVEANVSEDPKQYLPANVMIDCILHFASPASPPRYQANPIDTYLVNSIGTHTLLQYLKTNNPNGRFLFASTSEVYGDPLEHPQTESYWGNVNPNGARSCYDEAKRLGETICGVHEREYNMDVRIVRIFNTYGSRMDIDDGRVIPSFIKSALAGKPIEVYGDGSQTRSYCYVLDLVEGILRTASGDALKGITVNLGNPQEFTVLETAHLIWKEINQNDDAQISFLPLPADDPIRRRPNISLAKERLSWTPTISFPEGLKKTIEYFRSI